MFNKKNLLRLAETAGFAFASAFLVLLPGIVASPSLSVARDALVSAVIAGLAAAGKVVKIALEKADPQATPEIEAVAKSVEEAVAKVEPVVVPAPAAPADNSTTQGA